VLRHRPAARIDGVTDARPRIVIYRTVSCPFCVAAEELLRRKGAAFEQVYLDDHPDRRAFTRRLKPGHDTVPLVVVDGQPLGGFDALQALDARGELDAILRGGGTAPPAHQ
jgi:glutaredoxin 3